MSIESIERQTSRFLSSETPEAMSLRGAEALRIIGRESKLNASRIRRLGIKPAAS